MLHVLPAAKVIYPALPQPVPQEFLTFQLPAALTPTKTTP